MKERLKHSYVYGEVDGIFSLTILRRFHIEKTWTMMPSITKHHSSDNNSGQNEMSEMVYVRQVLAKPFYDKLLQREDYKTMFETVLINNINEVFKTLLTIDHDKESQRFKTVVKQEYKDILTLL